jgi:AcrR family transcriptional regulator
VVLARSRAQAERSRATRARIVAAATPLFVRDGYLETTMQGIAKAAGVAVQTLYLAFGSKVAVLEAALAAAADDVPAGDRPPEPGHTGGPAADGRALTGRAPGGPIPDGPAVLAEYVRTSAAAIIREYPLAAVLRAAAADPEPAELLDRTRSAALADHARTVDELADRPGFTDRISLQRATEIVAALLSPETYGLLVHTNGWTPQDWSDWVTQHLRSDLFPATD